MYFTLSLLSEAWRDGGFRKGTGKSTGFFPIPFLLLKILFHCALKPSPANLPAAKPQPQLRHLPLQLPVNISSHENETDHLHHNGDSPGCRVGNKEGIK